MMTYRQHQLLVLLKERAYEEGVFTLASGATSTYYIDCRRITVCSEGAFWIGEVLYEATKDLGIKAIGGLQVGAVPIVTAAVIRYYRYGLKMEWFWVREQTKDHGTRREIEGYLPAAGDRVVIVDDVVTSGRSVMRAVDAAVRQGAEVARVISLVDRELGTDRLFARQGLEYEPIFSITDLKED